MPRNDSDFSLRASCDACRKAKVRCDKTGTDCTRCSYRGHVCSFSPKSRRSGTQAVPRLHQHTITDIKSRLERLELLLSSSQGGKSADKDATAALLPVASDDKMAFCLTDRMGFLSFIGSSSGFSILSPHGLRKVTALTGSTELSDFIYSRARSYMIGWSEAIASACKPLESGGEMPLPPKHSAMISVNIYFSHMNTIIPLYNKTHFMLLFDQQYSEHPPLSISWYATLHAVIGIGELLLEDEIGANISGFHELEQNKSKLQAMRCLQTCYSVFTQLAYSCRELMAVQSLIGMAFILDMLLDAEASYMTIGAAARLAMSLGLHRTIVDSHLSPSEVEERRNVFWVLYIFDRSVSLRLGRPPTIHENDCDIAEPAPASAYQPSKVGDGFAHLVKLNRIKSEIYLKLYSIPSLTRGSGRERIANIQNLHEKLMCWQKSLPWDLMPLQQSQLCTDDVFNAMTFLLQAEYYNCQLMLYRTASDLEPSDSVDNPVHSITSSSSFSKESQKRNCLAAARHTAELLTKLKMSVKAVKSNMTRYFSYYPLSAFFDIFLNLLSNPHDPYTATDLQYLHFIVDETLGALTTSSSPLALLLVDVFQKMTEIAQNFLLRSNFGGRYDTGQQIGVSNITMESTSSVPGDLESNPSTTGSSADPAGHNSLSQLQHFASLVPNASSEGISEFGSNLWEPSNEPNLVAVYEPLTVAHHSMPEEHLGNIQP